MPISAWEGFAKSGFVLQDIVNEIGKRLGYDVQNGRYQGVVNQQRRKAV